MTRFNISINIIDKAAVKQIAFRNLNAEALNIKRYTVIRRSL